MSYIITLCTSQEFKKYLQGKIVYQIIFDTAAGPLRAFCTEDGIFEVSYSTELAKDVPVLAAPPKALFLVGTYFEHAVWQAASTIAAGSVIHYEQLAKMVGKPKACRAVANALGRNLLAWFIPCHRVIRKDGSLGDYAWGIERKQALLMQEGVSL